jgi:hypothetical protein
MVLTSDSKVAKWFSAIRIRGKRVGPGIADKWPSMRFALTVSAVAHDAAGKVDGTLDVRRVIIGAYEITVKPVTVCHVHDIETGPSVSVLRSVIRSTDTGSVRWGWGLKPFFQHLRDGNFIFKHLQLDTQREQL